LGDQFQLRLAPTLALESFHIRDRAHRRAPIASNGPAKAALRREIEALSQGVTITRCEAHKRTPKPRRAPTAQITEGKEAA